MTSVQDSVRVTGTGAAASLSLGVDLSVIIPALNEGDNLALLLPELREVLDGLTIAYEIVVVTVRSDFRTQQAALAGGAEVCLQTLRGYGGALLAGFERATGRYILTMDADLSHRPLFVRDMWARRGQAEITIASRYVPGGSAEMPKSRYLLSRVLNSFFRRGLSQNARDLSSGFRLYKAEAVKGHAIQARDFDILQEILVRATAEGWRVQEVPFRYSPRRHGNSHARVLRFGVAYLRRFLNLWRLRNSILSADYDDRAYDSPIPLQRYWQRTRYRIITSLVSGQGTVLDVGCGSSRIIGALPAGSVALDIAFRKTLYARKFGRNLVQGSGLNLPFADGSFACVLCSQVIEHIPKHSNILDELCRVLAPGGRLVLGTPDYARWEWVTIEKLYGLAAPGGYADEHVSHFTQRELVGLLEGKGYRLEEKQYILRGELILAFRKNSVI